MKINLKTTNIDLDEALRIWVEKKIGEIDKFLGDFDSAELLAGEREKIEAWVEIGKTTKHHLKGEIFRAEAQLYLPGKKIRATATDIDLRVAVNGVKDLLQREIKKYKGKRLARARSWARNIKKGFRTPSFLRVKAQRKILEILKRKK